MRILIAEDERITRRSLQRQLEGWSHDVIAAEDGAAAWTKFQEQQFDIVVTDWDMPRMDGQQLIQHIRGSNQAGYAYVIMLTGRSEKTDLVAGMEAGADDFLAKPFDGDELRVRVHAGERIIQLERRLAQQNQQLQTANDHMKHDLDAAAAMQRDLLPKDLPDSLGVKFAWHFEPCDELGGDILNVVPLDDHSVAMYLLDVCGHGVPAALLSVTLNRVLTARDPTSSILIHSAGHGAAPKIRSPKEVADHLNRQFPMDGKRGQFFTMAYAVLDTETFVLRYVVAGHPPPILVRGNCAPQELSGGNIPIGIMPDAEFRDCSVQLQPGDRVYTYSDGVTEAFNDRGDMLTSEGLMKLIEHSRTGTLSDDLASCMEQLRCWCHATPLADDISLLVLEVPAP